MPLVRRAGWGVAIAATLGMSVSYIDRQTLAAIAPSVRTALAIDHTQFGWLVSAFSMAYLVGAPAAGVVIDRLGARRGFAVAVVVWSAVAAAHSLAASFASLFVLRVLLGAAEAPSFPAAAQAIRRALPGARRTAAYGLLFTGSSIGSMVAAPLAVGLEGRYGFRTAFFGTAAVGLLWIPFWLVMTRGDRIPPDEVAVEVEYLVERWHLAKLETRWYLVVPPLFFDVGAVGFGWWASTRETPRVNRTHVGLFALAAALASLLVLAPLASSPGAAMAIFGAAAAGGGGIYVLVRADMLSRVPLGKTAAAQSLAHVIASPLVGMAIDRTHSYDATLVALGLVVVPTSLAFLLWPGLRTR